MLAGRLLMQIFSWAVTIIVIRLLTPADYGLMALAMIFIGFFGLFEELGLSGAIVNKKDLGKDTLRGIFGLLIIAGVVMYAATYAIAPYAAAFFDESQLIEILHVLAWQPLIGALAALPEAMIQRRLQFRTKSIIEFTAGVSASLTTLVLALNGAGVWSLVYGTLCQTTVSMLGFWFAFREPVWPRFDMRNLGSEIRFGGFIALDRILWYMYSQADSFLIGKFLGKELLGIYAVAIQLSTFPMQKTMAILNEVGFAAFSRIQTDREQVREKLLLAVRSLSLVALPVFFGISVVAPELVTILLGPKWSSVVLPLTLLSLIVPIRMFDAMTPTVLFGIGRADRQAGNSLIALLMMVPAFAAAAYFGDIFTICLVWLTVYPLYFLICLKRSLPILNLTIPHYLSQIWKYFVMAAAMYAGVAILPTLFDVTAGTDLTSLIASIVLGVLIYTALLWLYDRQNLIHLVEIVRS
jgi:O-antigen/teichoic acid export membrane protein